MDSSASRSGETASKSGTRCPLCQSFNHCEVALACSDKKEGGEIGDCWCRHQAFPTELLELLKHRGALDCVCQDCLSHYQELTYEG